ncbi:hypothetical protein LTR53_004831 [Teratosphaeriaceae sp. CCFEE 6253]|nr:hypothetical protein LTR53_004831 [Teratosphaeriaceae sp. CCFEE 6253]
MASNTKTRIQDALSQLREARERIDAIEKQANDLAKAIGSTQRANFGVILDAVAADVAAIDLRIEGLTKRLDGRLSKTDMSLAELLVPYTLISLDPEPPGPASSAGDFINASINDDDSDPTMAREWSDYTWEWSRQPENAIRHAPCIVRHPNDRFYVLACPVCGGNSTQRSGFLKGAKAFYDHVLQGHGSQMIKGLGVAATIEACQVRRLTRLEAAELHVGTAEAPEIKMIMVKREVNDEVQRVSRKRKAGTRAVVTAAHAQDEHASSMAGPATGHEVEARRSNQASDDGSGGVPIEPQAKRSKKDSHYLHSWLSAGFEHDEDEDGDEDDEVALGLQQMGMAAVTAEVQGSMPSWDARTVKVPVRQLDEQYDSKSDGT